MIFRKGNVHLGRFNLSFGKRLTVKSAIPPFYYPSTVIFIDDSLDFLSNLSLLLDAGLAFRLYGSPTKALNLLNFPSAAQTPLAESFLSAIASTNPREQSAHHVLEINASNIIRQLHNPHRFDQISVIVIDYDMPAMNGLDFCRALENPAIKKILLTGKADAKVAVQAFNQKLIDRFITKQDEDVIPLLNRAIVDMQREYFENQGRQIMDALAIGSHTFLRETVFIEEFRKICMHLKIVEYYLVFAPDGILMRDANGASSLLLVLTQENMRANFESAYNAAAPTALLNALRSNNVVSYFWQTGQYGPDCTNWEICLYPATELRGIERYYYTIVPSPPGFDLSDVTSYNEYLALADQKTNAP